MLIITAGRRETAERVETEGAADFRSVDGFAAMYITIRGSGVALQAISV